jgi:PAS domain S-box-containing protein
MSLAAPILLKQLRRRSIRTHLVLLVLCSVLPMMGIIVCSGLEHGRHELAEARERCEQIADHIAREQENMTASARQVLSTLALLPELKRRDAAACNALFGKIVRLNPQFATLNASTPEGVGFAAAFPFPTLPVADRKYHRDVLATRAFAVGEFVVSRVSGVSTLNYACPVWGDGGELAAVVSLGSALRYYQGFLALAHAPEGSTLVITDHAGTILYSSLHYGQRAGQPDSPALQRQMRAGAALEGRFTLRDPDGSNRLYIYRSLRLAGQAQPYLYVRVGLPEAQVYREVRAVVTRNLGLLGVAALISLVLAWLLVERRIMRRVRQLVDASRRLAGGDLQATTGIPHDEGELGQLARSFDEMGQALARQEAERVRVVEALQLTQYAVDHVSQAITWIDADGTRLYANEAFCRLTGYPREELIGARFSMVTRPQDRNYWEELWAGVKAQGARLYESTVVTKSGEERLVEVVATHINFSGREFLMGSMRDITTERQAEERLRQAQKMEAIGTLAGGIAHDFNNLLTGILGYANLLTLEASPGSQTFEAARVIEKAAERAAELTRQLLGFARKGKFLNVPFKVHPLIGEVVSILDRTLDKGITITQRLAAPQTTLVGDPNQIQQVILNLAVNARDAMPQGGSLTIETALVHLDETYCRAHPQVTPGPYVMIAVSDTGHGIPKAVQARIFEPFFTTKDEGKGTGMGLAMVYGIVKNHHGTVHVYSEEGHGARFCIYLPAPPEGRGEARLEDGAARNGQGARAGGRILLVDDEEIVLRLGRAMLEKLGCQVRPFADPAEAARHYAENWRDYDLVILDMIMPGLDGRECFQAMKQANPAVRAILSSGYSRGGRAQEILDEGLCGFIQKPYHLRELAAAVTAALRADSRAE